MVHKPRWTKKPDPFSPTRLPMRQPETRARAIRRQIGRSHPLYGVPRKWTPHPLSMVKLLWFASYGVS